MFLVYPLRLRLTSSPTAERYAPTRQPNPAIAFPYPSIATCNKPAAAIRHCESAAIRHHRAYNNPKSTPNQYSDLCQIAWGSDYRSGLLSLRSRGALFI